MRKQSVVWFMLALLTMLAAANICWAVEEDEDGNIRQSQPLALEGDDSVAPKPKVIIKERVVMKCAPGTVWSPRNKRCISEDGEAPPPPRYQATAPQQQAEAPRGDRYVYPGTKLRIKLDKCTMVGETARCEHIITNAAEGSTGIWLDNSYITDEFGSSYKIKNWESTIGYRPTHYGESGRFISFFPLVNPAATQIVYTMHIKANNGNDLVRFSGVPLIK